MTPENRARYPDAVVTCPPRHWGATIVDAPVAIFEVLSPGTSRTDRIDKTREYRSIETVQRYVILEADSIAATVFLRDGVQWRTYTLIGGDMLELPEISVAFPLAEAYAGVDFENVGEPGSA